MNTVEMWQVLDMEPTKDEDLIVNAYRSKVVTVNPEDDQEGFMRLREAFEMAIKFAREDDVLTDKSQGKPDSEKTDVDRHIDKLNEIYSDIHKRKDLNLWKEWFADPLCVELDTADAMREATLVYLMRHFYLQFEVWKMMEDTFNIEEDKDILKEKFPEDFIGFVIYRIHNEDFVDFDAFITREEAREKTKGLIDAIELPDRDLSYEDDEYDAMIDSYIKAISSTQSIIQDYIQKKYDAELDESVDTASAEASLDTLVSILRYVKGFDDWHPIELGAEMRALELTGHMEDALTLARSIVYDKTLDMHRYTTPIAAYMMLKDLKNREEAGEEVDPEEREHILTACKEVIDKIEEMQADSAMMLMAKSYYYLIQKDFFNASDSIIEVLDINTKNSEAIVILKKISSEAANYFEAKREAGTITEEEKLELSWSYFRLEKLDPIIPILDTIQPDDEIKYGYNNLYGRCYSAQNEFEKAEPYLKTWTETMDDMRRRASEGEVFNKKDRGRLSRAAFCYYMYAQCEDHLDNIDLAAEFYKKSIILAKEESNDINEELFYQESLGKMYERFDRYQDSMEVWNNMIESVDHCVPAYIHRQETAYIMKDAQLVIDDYYNIIRDFPSYSRAYAIAARVFLIYKQFKDVKNVLDHAEEAGIESDYVNWMKCRFMDLTKNLNEEDQESVSGNDIKEKEKVIEELYKSIADSIQNEDSDLKDEELTDFYADAGAFLINLRDEKGNRNRLADVTPYVEAGLKLDKKNKRLLWLKTDVEEFSDRPAYDIYNEMLTYYPDDAVVFYEYGEYLMRVNKTSEAEPMYRKALEFDPDHPRANNKLMDIYQRRFSDSENKEDYDKAVAFATRQLEIVDDEYYRVERLLLYMDGGEIDKAEADARKAIEQNEDNVYGYNGLGLCLLRKRDYEGAIASFGKAIEVMKDDETPAPYTNIAKCYEQMEHFEEAILYTKKLMDIFGSAMKYKYVLARLYVKNEQYTEALEIYDEFQNHYRELLAETKNKWYASDVVKYLIKMVDVANLSGNDQLAQSRLGVLNYFLKEQGYTNKSVDESTHGNERKVAADIFRQLGDFYVNNQRQYKTAILCFEKSLRFMMQEGTKGPVRSIADDSPQILGFFKRAKANTYVERPENLENPDYNAIGDLYKFFAIACFNYGLKDWAKDLATRAINCYEKADGSIDSYLSFPSSAPLRLNDMAMLVYMRGDKEEALRLTEESVRIPQCEFCTYGDCYDKILTLARIYEMSGDITKAIEYYRIAYNKTKNDPEIYMALRTLDGNGSVNK